MERLTIYLAHAIFVQKVITNSEEEIIISWNRLEIENSWNNILRVEPNWDTNNIQGWMEDIEES